MLALEAGEDPLGVAAARQRVGEVAGHPVDDRDPQQEVAQVGRLLGQHLGEQVVRDGGVVAGEVGDELLRLRVRAQGQRREPQPRRPALGALPELLDQRALELDARGAEQVPGLLEAEGEIGLAQLLQRTRDAQPREPQRRVGARRDDQPQVGRRLAQEPVEVGEHRRLADLVQVVEDDDQWPLEAFEAVDDRRPDQVDGLARVDGDGGQRVSDAGAADRLQQPAQEAAPLAVGRLEREPRDGALVAGAGPRAQQRRLAGARRGGDQRDRALRAAVELAQQPGTLDHRGRHARRHELRTGQLDRLGGQPGGAPRFGARALSRTARRH